MSEIFGIHGLVVAVVALLVIGPKDLPKAMRAAGYWVGKARGISRQFRQGFDNMVREAEIEEMEKRWAAENERIMREHPRTDPEPPVEDGSHDVIDRQDTERPSVPIDRDQTERPVMVEKPVVEAAPLSATEPRPDATPS